ncbi:hypothetical protein ACX80W_03290 [Arthrobacter sp. TMN-37]
MNLPFGRHKGLIGARCFLAAGIGAAVMGTTAACTPYSGTAPPCFPPAFSVTPAAAAPGETVTVAAPPVDCDPRYGDDARIRIVVTDERGVEAIDTTAPMTDAGEFAYTFPVPARMAVGKASVMAEPDDVDWCDDTGRNNRIQGSRMWERTSCVLPVEPLTITH